MFLVKKIKFILYTFQKKSYDQTLIIINHWKRQIAQFPQPHTTLFPALNQPSSFPPHLHPLFFKILVSPPLFSVPLPFKVFSTVLLTLMQPPPALIQSINLSWVKRISKGRFYQFDCRFLSKINFPYFKSLYK